MDKQIICTSQAPLIRIHSITIVCLVLSAKYTTEAYLKQIYTTVGNIFVGLIFGDILQSIFLHISFFLKIVNYLPEF